MTDGVDGPLAGFTVGVTAARRREELTALLERRGARVISAPAIRIVPLEDDGNLVAATRECLSGIDIVVATTGIGFRGWLEGAEGAGLAERLLRVMGDASLVARGPKARGAIRAVGLTESWSPESESVAEVLDYLTEQDLDGKRVAVQLHGQPLPEFVAALRDRGADVLEVPVYRWELAEDTAPLERLVELIALRLVDAVTFTSAPAASALLEIAGGDSERMLEAFRRDVLAACVGQVCAVPLERVGVPALVAQRARLGGLVRTLVDHLPEHRSRAVEAAGHRLEIRGHLVLVDGDARALPPAQMTVLRTLAEAPGRVVSRAALLEMLPRSADAHAVEMAIARLRVGLGDSAIIRTVTKRGYQLAVS